YLAISFFLSPFLTKFFPSYNLAHDSRPNLKPEMEFGAIDFAEPSLVWYFRDGIHGFMTPLKRKQAAELMSRSGGRFVVLPTIGVGGVRYEVFIPLSSYHKLPGCGQPIEIPPHLHVREAAQILYGFMSAPERDLFRLLVNHVSGIGPKLALGVLSGMSVNNFKAAVVNNDVALLSKISGVGKKTAERMVLELKDRVGVAA